ncbi:MAG: lipid-A-disaccharide synthase [Pirellulales bacterium]|nr:lipid-A-disaccharide synthase [Pirellulales bacterium]
MEIFFSAGDPSGDLHAANLIRQLQRRRPGIRCVGYGGPEMARAGCHLHADLTSLAVMWFLRAILNLHKFLLLLWRADRYFRLHRPDALVLVDYPGFNWWMARRAKAHGIPVFYFAPPQIWAWASWRVKKMRRYVDHVLCSLPFEESWLRDRGCRAVFVGHPFFDECRHRRLDQAFLDREIRQPGRLVTILPGSRTQEVEQNLAWLLKAATLVHMAVPDVRFAIAAFKPQHAEYARRLAANCHLPLDVHVRRTPELIELAECCLAVSGSVSLELLYHVRPTVVLYRLGRVAYRVQGWFRRVKYITLVNLLAARTIFVRRAADFDPHRDGGDEMLFPEFLTCEDRTGEMAAQIIRWLVDPLARRERMARLARLKVRVGMDGATRRAAKYVLRVLEAPARVPAPHFKASSLRRSRHAPASSDTAADDTAA